MWHDAANKSRRRKKARRISRRAMSIRFRKRVTPFVFHAFPSLPAPFSLARFVAKDMSRSRGEKDKREAIVPRAKIFPWMEDRSKLVAHRLFGCLWRERKREERRGIFLYGMPRNRRRDVKRISPFAELSNSLLASYSLVRVCAPYRICRSSRDFLFQECEIACALLWSHWGTRTYLW